MSHLTRFFVLIFLITLCLKAVNAQEPDTNRDESETIPHAEVITKLFNFTVEGTEDCVLPCIAGIHPDETTLYEIQELAVDLFDDDESILKRFDNPFEREDGVLVYSLIASSSTITGYFALGFLIVPEDEVLRRFEAHLSHPENWLDASNLDIAEILAILGEPDAIYISISAAQPSYFDIALGYETKGILFRYKYFFEPEQLTQSEEPIPLCGSWSKTYSVDVWIQAVDEELYTALLEEYLRLSESESTEETVYRAFWPLERMTDWSTKELTQFLAENQEWCFDALSYEELLDAGYSY